MKLRLISFLILAFEVLNAQGPNNDLIRNDSLFRFYLQIVKMQLDYEQSGYLSDASYFYVAYVDTINMDTVYKILYLEEAIKFLEFKTNIYLRRGKFGGYILTEDVYNRWFQWYQHHVLNNK